MTIFRLYKVDGWASNYYHIENETTLGYYLDRKKAESHPEYQEYLRKKAEGVNYDDEDDFYNNDPHYVGIEEIEVE